jgi:hypothetical protein
MVQASLGKKQVSISKMIRVKIVGGLAQEVHHLPSKCKALSSNCTTTKRKRNPQKGIKFYRARSWFKWKSTCLANIRP